MRTQHLSFALVALAMAAMLLLVGAPIRQAQAATCARVVIAVQAHRTVRSHERCSANYSTRVHGRRRGRDGVAVTLHRTAQTLYIRASNRGSERRRVVVGVVYRWPLKGIGDIPGCAKGTPDRAVLRWYSTHEHASFVRVNALHTRSNADWIACTRRLLAKGWKVELTPQWGNRWSLARIEARYATELSAVGSKLWAVGVGNEQGLKQGVAESPQRYATIWRALLPIIKRYAPHAKLLACEAAAWELGWCDSALRAGLPDAQAIAAHPYNCKVTGWAGCKTPRQWLDFANVERLPLWNDESLWMPRSPYNKVDGNERIWQLAGAAVGAAWLIR